MTRSSGPHIISARDMQRSAKPTGWLTRARALLARLTQSVIHGIIHALARPFRGQHTPSAAPQKPPKRDILATRIWHITWQGEVSSDLKTSAVMISGVWRTADIVDQARAALERQLGVANVRILRVSLDCDAARGVLDPLPVTTRESASRQRFKEECG